MKDKIFRAVGSVIRLPYVWIPALVLSFLALGLGLGMWQNLCVECPSIAQIYAWEPTQAAKVYARNGELIAELGVERRTPVAVDDLPEHVAQAFIAVEDKRFYAHRGVDPRGVMRAVYGLLTRRSSQLGGGSTITQQLARNMFDELGFERSLLRKLKEMRVAFQLERAYSKEQILAAYINQINYGQNWLGIQTASRNYFGKPASELAIEEAALLAAIPKSPSNYSPLRHPDAALDRRNLVLRRMRDQDMITPTQFEELSATPVPTERAQAHDGIAPYFVEHVRQILDDRFGGQLYRAGFRVYTTLDIEMQKAANQAMQRGLDAVEQQPGYAHDRYAEWADSASFPGNGSPYVQGALVAVESATGAVRGLVGGRDFNQSKFNRVTQAQRQAGSSFKPFVYTSAIASMVPASHVVVDAPVVLPQLDGTEWKPRNFTGEFNGPMTIREALRRSINMVAIKLAMEVGLETVVQTAKRMGLRTDIERVPATAIGAATVIPMEMAEAYTTFSNLGEKVRPFVIERVEAADGEVLWDPQPEVQSVVDPAVARIMVSMMEGVVASGTGASVRASLPYDVSAAGKTGTTNNSTDTWFVGYTPNLTALVWFGMDQPQPTRPNATGGGDAAPVWGEFMKMVYYGQEETDTLPAIAASMEVPQPWPSVDGISTREVDRVTGKLASQWCPEEDIYTEMYLSGTEPTDICDRSGLTLIGQAQRPVVSSGEPGR